MTDQLNELLETMPAVAILRGVTEDKIVDVADVILAAGIRLIEVPLNSPNAYDSITRLCSERRGLGLFGCGTCTNLSELNQVAQTGAELVVTPNVNPELITTAIEWGLTPIPGYMTPTEAFTAYAAGARYLKLFPAANLGINHYLALKEILPDDVKTLAVGGVSAQSAKQWIKAGMSGIGVGSEIFKPNRDIDEIASRAMAVASALKAED